MVSQHAKWNKYKKTSRRSFCGRVSAVKNLVMVSSVGEG